MKTSNTKAFDMISIGSCQVNFLGQQIGSSLKDMLSFEKDVGGISPLVNIACAHLGLLTALISKVAQDPMGRFIVDTLKQEKVDLSQVKQEHNAKSTLSFNTLPQKEGLRDITPLFIEENEIDAQFIAQGKILFISTALFENELSNRATRKAIIAATESQTKIILVLDANCSPHIVETVFPLCDVILGSANHFQQLTDKQNTQFALEHIRSVTNALLVLVLEKGCFAYPKAIDTPWQKAINHPGFSTENPYQIIGLEAFIAGWIKATIHDLPLEQRCLQGSACQALVQERKGLPSDFPSAPELDFFLTQHQVTPKIQSAFFSQLHHGSTRRLTQDELCLFSFGYHAKWTKMAEPFAGNESIVSHLKDLLAQGVRLLAQNESPAGIMVDDHILQKSLDHFSSETGLLVRSVEMPHHVPLKFSLDQDITSTLLKWPKHHIAKVSFIYHPDDRFALRQEQEATLALLYRACRTTCHELMIDIAPPTNSLITASTIGHVMQRLYDVGIYPDWWQINAPRDIRAWDSIQRTIDENDVYCKGVIVQAPLATFEQLPVLFETSVKQKHCKGFSVSRAIYQTHIEQWLSQKIADNVLIDSISNNMQKVLDLWNQSKNAVTTGKFEKVV